MFWFVLSVQFEIVIELHMNFVILKLNKFCMGHTNQNFHLELIFLFFLLLHIKI